MLEKPTGSPPNFRSHLGKLSARQRGTPQTLALDYLDNAGHSAQCPVRICSKLSEDEHMAPLSPGASPSHYLSNFLRQFINASNTLYQPGPYIMECGLVGK